MARREQPFALFVGGRGGYKNCFLALEAFALSKFGREATLVCSGTPLTELEMKYIRRLKLEHRVQVQPRVSTAKLVDLYRHAEVLLYPSGYEGFGFPIVEAMSQGCPVIASNRSAIPETAGHAGVLLSDLDPQSMADAIDRVVEPANRRQLSRLAVQNAARFTWAASAEAHEGLYRELS
ncbi:MAG: glycosyltransferase [Gemmatimonadota bacterium]|nr:glycosyltransferase [Gemmatimonadota bacterium]